MEKMKLKRIGENASGNMVYQNVDTGKYYLDLNYGFGETLDLHTCGPSDDMDGEPDFPLKREYEIINPITDREKREKQYQFQYMMLGRLIGDCRAFFGDGRGDKELEHLVNSWPSIKERLLAEMKKEDELANFKA